MKEKEKARKTNGNRASGGVAIPSPKGDTRVSLKVGGVGLNVNGSSSRRTLKEGASEKPVKTPANSNKLLDNSTAAGISHMGDVTAKSSNKANSNSPLETSDKMMESSVSGVLLTHPDRSTMILR
jgi:hypothetical protein